MPVRLLANDVVEMALMSRPSAAPGPTFPNDCARLERFELSTPGFVGRCSIQMSYSRS